MIGCFRCLAQSRMHNQTNILNKYQLIVELAFIGPSQQRIDLARQCDMASKIWLSIEGLGQSKIWYNRSAAVPNPFVVSKTKREPKLEKISLASTLESCYYKGRSRPIVGSSFEQVFLLTKEANKMFHHLKVQFDKIGEVRKLPHYAFVTKKENESTSDALSRWICERIGKIENVFLVEDSAGKEMREAAE